MRKLLLTFLFLWLFASVHSALTAFPVSVAGRSPRADGDPYALIAEVNALRAARGLPAYNISPILMGTAQGQADYMASTGQVTHYGPGGITLTQRLLAAGYPLAGDLNLGGIRSENIMSSGQWEPATVIQAWLGDAAHTNTMLSPNLVDIGAGVTLMNGEYYYVIDCARPTNSNAPYISPTPPPTLPGGTPGVAYDPVSAPPLVSTVYPSTPLPDGKLIHVVGGGETLWLIAITYNVKVADIRRLNNMGDNEAIYPGEKLIIKIGVPTYTPEPQPATETWTPSPTHAPLATDTPIPAETATPTLTPAPPESASSSSGIILLVIVLAALVTAGVLAVSFKRVQ